MRKMKFHLCQFFRTIIYKKKYYFLMGIAIYIGLLLPVCCLANIRSVGQIFKYTMFDGIEKSVIIDWFSKSFDLVDTTDVGKASISAKYEENIIEWDNQYTPIKGVDQYDFLNPPKISGRYFQLQDYKMGKKVCVIGINDSKNHKIEIGDYIKIQNESLKVIGVFEDPKWDAIEIPYGVMRNIYEGKQGIQFSGCFLFDNQEQKEKIINNVLTEIKEKDNDAQVLFTKEGAEYLEESIQLRREWRGIRILFMTLSILFFICNETIVLMGSMEREKKKIAIQLAMGAEIREINAGYLIVTLLITLIAAVGACASLTPLATFFSLEGAIVVDNLVVWISILISIIVCEGMMWGILCSLKKTQICELLKRDTN